MVLPWFAATALTLLYVLIRDGLELSARSLVVLAGTLSTGMLLVYVVDASVRFIELTEQRATKLCALAVAIAAGGPLVFGLARWWGARGSLPWWTPAALLAAGAAVAVALYLAPRPKSCGLNRWGPALAMATMLPIVGLLLTHHATGTLWVIRPKTEFLHVALYVGTWLLTCALIMPIATRYFSVGSNSQRGLTEYLAGAFACVTGVALLEVDQRMFVDLYDALHLWLGGLGILSLDSGLRMLISSSRHRAVQVLSVVAAVMMAVSSGWLVGQGGRVYDVGLRSQLSQTAIGASVLQIFRPVFHSTAARSAGHPAMNYEKFLTDKSPLEKPNVLLLSVDTLRRDVILARGQNNPRMPHLQRFADEALNFRRAWAQGPLTAMGMGSLMVGRYAENIDWDLWFWKRGRFANPKHMTSDQLAQHRGKFVFTAIPAFTAGDSLAERLRLAGYATAATAYAPGDFFRPGVGFDMGFDHFDDLTGVKWKSPTSARIVDRALKHLDHIEPPWLLWIHLYDPHENKRRKDRYNSLLKHTDAAFARLRKGLETRGVYEETLIGVVSDHGEAFGEHRHKGHGSSLFEEQIAIPMLLRVPTVTGRDVNHGVAAIDLTATIAVAAGAPTNDLNGVNLLPLAFDGRYPERRPIFSGLHRYRDRRGKRSHDLRAVMLGNHKLIIDRRRGTALLYDHVADPNERVDLRTSRPEVFDELLGILMAHLEHGASAHPLPDGLF